MTNEEKKNSPNKVKSKEGCRPYQQVRIGTCNPRKMSDIFIIGLRKVKMRLKVLLYHQRIYTFSLCNNDLIFFLFPFIRS